MLPHGKWLQLSSRYVAAAPEITFPPEICSLSRTKEHERIDYRLSKDICDLIGFAVNISFFILRIRVPWPFQWGAPSFDAGEAFAMMMASFVALVEVCD